MQLKFFVVTVSDSDQAEAKLNRFLASQRVLAIDRGRQEPPVMEAR